MELQYTQRPGFEHTEIKVECFRGVGMVYKQSSNDCSYFPPLLCLISRGIAYHHSIHSHVCSFEYNSDISFDLLFLPCPISELTWRDAMLDARWVSSIL